MIFVFSFLFFVFFWTPSFTIVFHYFVKIVAHELCCCFSLWIIYIFIEKKIGKNLKFFPDDWIDRAESGELDNAAEQNKLKQERAKHVTWVHVPYSARPITDNLQPYVPQRVYDIEDARRGRTDLPLKYDRSKVTFFLFFFDLSLFAYWKTIPFDNLSFNVSIIFFSLFFSFWIESELFNPEIRILLDHEFDRLRFQL